VAELQHLNTRRALHVTAQRQLKYHSICNGLQAIKIWLFFNFAITVIIFF